MVEPLAQPKPKEDMKATVVLAIAITLLLLAIGITATPTAFALGAGTLTLTVGAARSWATRRSTMTDQIARLSAPYPVPRGWDTVDTSVPDDDESIYGTLCLTGDEGNHDTNSWEGSIAH